MLTVDQFLSAVQKNVDRIYEYMLGCDGSNGKCDCIGLIIGAVRLAGLKWTGTHGSNYAARSMTNNLHAVSKADQLKRGMIVYKARKPGDANYSLPSKYKTSGDLNDYYHVGVVTSESPFKIKHCTSVAGGIKVDNALGKWAYAGELTLVNYDGGDEPMPEPIYQAKVVAESGGSVRMRSLPSVNSKVVKNVKVGTIVEVLEESNDTWDKIRVDGVTGYMMRKFLQKIDDHDDGDDGDDEMVEVSREMMEDLHECLSAALDILETMMSQADVG